MSNADDKLVSGDVHHGQNFSIFETKGSGMPMYYAEVHCEGSPKTKLRLRITDTISDVRKLIESKGF